MPVEERRRIALRSQMVATWGEEAAQTLFELLTPAGHEMATRADLEAGFAAMDVRFTAVDARFAVLEERLDGMDRRFDERLGAMDRRFDERLGAMDRRFDERIDGMEGRLDAHLGAIDGRLETMEQRSEERTESAIHQVTAAFERRISEAVTMQTRTLVWSQLAALVTVTALAFGLR